MLIENCHFFILLHQVLYFYNHLLHFLDKLAQK